jgi:hypothetical protein
MKLDFRPVRVATGSDDEDGLLAFAGDRLVAVLVRLSEMHDDMAGLWFLEASFGLRDERQNLPGSLQCRGLDPQSRELTCRDRSRSALATAHRRDSSAYAARRDIQIIVTIAC